ncbi:50S ribosomal protein L24 [Patescibacteria group bacterium]|nr:50S ribosomal protein L24 [Patescibacteria group bacterium]
MKIKKGDKVKILTGKDKGKKGKVLQVLNGRDKLSIEGINLLYKNMRPKKQGETGQRIQFPAPIAISNVTLLCPKCNRITRVSYKSIRSENTVSGTKKVKVTKSRICKKCKEII